MISNDVLELIRSCITCENAAAPNAIQDLVYELLLDRGMAEDYAETVAEAAFELASSLVITAGHYL